MRLTFSRVGSRWRDGRGRLPDYLPAVLDELVTAGLVALAAPDPVSETWGDGGCLKLGLNLLVNEVLTHRQLPDPSMTIVNPVALIRSTA